MRVEASIGEIAHSLTNERRLGFAQPSFHALKEKFDSFRTNFENRLVKILRLEASPITLTPLEPIADNIVLDES